MAFITGPALVATKDAGGSVVVAANSAIRFVGAVVAPDGAGQTVVTVGGGGFMLTNFSNSVASTKDIDFGTFKGVNAGNPTAPQDLATKFYVDSAISGWGLSGNALVGGEVFGSTNGVPVVGVYNAVQYFIMNANGIFFDNPGSYKFLFNTKAFTFGFEGLGSNIQTALGIGAFAFGFTDNNSGILSQGSGSLAFGYADASSNIQSNGLGTFAFGFADSAGGLVNNAQGALIFGRADGGIITNGAADGSLAFGYTAGGGSINVGGDAAIASGRAVNGSNITASGVSSHASGYADGLAGTPIQATGIASTARGYSTAGFVITASGRTSFAYGDLQIGNLSVSGTSSFAVGDDSSVFADYASMFGIGHQINAYLGFHIGRYSSSGGGTPNAWVSTDPLFVIGNGSSNVSRSDAFRVDKDGYLFTSGSHQHRAIRVVNAAAAISGRTDRTIICDLAGAGGNLTLPVGVDGLEFRFGLKNAGAAVYTLVPSGADVLDANVPAITGAGGPVAIQYLGGIWYLIP